MCDAFRPQLTFLHLLSTFLLLGCPVSSAQPVIGGQQHGDEWKYAIPKDICESSKKTPFPSDDLPTDKDRQAVKDCSSSVLYTGDEFLRPDFEKARKCAYIERENNFEMLGGSGVLAMIYANGEGVQTNIDLALRFMCEEPNPVNALGAAITFLIARKSDKSNASFNICDYAVGTPNMSICADPSAHINAWKKNIHAMHGSWSRVDISHYYVLEKAAEAFVTHAEQVAYWDWCIGMWCTGGGFKSVREFGRLWAVFYRTLAIQLENGKMPPITSQSFKQADADLNHVYHEIVAETQKRQNEVAYYGDPVNLKPLDELKAAELAWIRYRDAWDRFGSLKYRNLIVKLASGSDHRDIQINLAPWSTTSRIALHHMLQKGLYRLVNIEFMG